MYLNAKVAQTAFVFKSCRRIKPREMYKPKVSSADLVKTIGRLITKQEN